MNDNVLARSFAAQLAELHRDMLKSWHAEAPDAGLVEWAALKSDGVARLGISLPELAVTHIPGHRWAEAPILAAVGYRLAFPATAQDAAGLWLDSVRRLIARDPIPADRNSFFFRPVEGLLGLAVGSQALTDKDDAPLRWLRDLLAASGHAPPSNWHVACSHSRTGGEMRKVPDGISQVAWLEPGTATEIAVLLFLHFVDENLAAAATPTDREALTRQLLETVGMSAPQPQSLGERGILCIASSAISSPRPSAA